MGPVITHSNGNKFYYLSGMKIPKESFKMIINSKYGASTNDKNNIMIEYKVKEYNDRTEWYTDGKLNRLDGPAIEYKNGSKYWYTNGKLNRLDGPAMILANGNKYWYIEDKEYSVYDFNNINKHSCIDKIVEIDGKKYHLKEIK